MDTWTGPKSHAIIKVSSPISVPCLRRTSYLSGMWLGLDLSMGTESCVLKGVWTMCIKFVNYSRCNSQHNWGGPK